METAKEKRKIGYIRRGIAVLDSVISHVLLFGASLVFLLGFYALWDSNQVQLEASSSQYQSYKPTSDTTDELASFSGFQKLQKINPDVLGWLNIYGTNIDYPLVQTTDNDTYLNKNAKKEDSVTGALFLDYRSSPNFDDFNTIIHGHHMDNGLMFGDIDKFVKKAYFKKHRYGTIYYNGEEKGIEIVAILEADAYDSTIYQPGIYGEENRLAYVDNLLSKSLHKRNITLTANDQLVLMSTCFLDVANGRYLLVARITDDVHPNPFDKSNNTPFPYNLFDDSLLGKWLKKIPLLVWYLIIAVLVILLIVLAIILYKHLKRYYEKRKRLKKA